jgi:hypothetical protein
MKTCKRHSTGANRGNRDGIQNPCSLCFLRFKSGRAAFGNPRHFSLLSLLPPV